MAILDFSKKNKMNPGTNSALIREKIRIFQKITKNIPNKSDFRKTDLEIIRSVCFGKINFQNVQLFCKALLLYKQVREKSHIIVVYLATDAFLC